MSALAGESAKAVHDDANKRRLGDCKFPHNFEAADGGANIACTKCGGEIDGLAAGHYMDSLQRVVDDPPWGKMRGKA